MKEIQKSAPQNLASSYNQNAFRLKGNSSDVSVPLNFNTQEALRSSMYSGSIERKPHHANSQLWNAG